MHKNQKLPTSWLARAAWVACFSSLVLPCAAAPVLGSAAQFVVLGASAVTNTGATTLVGDLGVYPGTAISGIGTVVLTGSVHNHDAVAQLAQADAQTAYGVLAGQVPSATLTGQDLGGLTLFAGTYFFASAAQLTGTLTLDAQNDPDAQFIFQIGSTLITASHAAVQVLHGSAKGVYWQVGSSATFGDSTLFAGSVLADQSITLNRAATLLCGRAIALHAAVTMDNNTLSNQCPNAGGTVPEPATWALTGAALLLLVPRRRSPRRWAAI